MAMLRKAYYQTDEVCRRWGMTGFDLSTFVLSGDLVLSVPVARLRVTHVMREPVGDGTHRMVTAGQTMLRGPTDLHAEDAWYALDVGTQGVFRFVAPGGGLYEIEEELDGRRPFTFTREMLVIRHAEMDRFETLHDLQPASAPVEQGAPVGRGARPRYDWDQFWMEMCRRIRRKQIPATQAAMVHGMESWFEDRGGAPDESLIKKKLREVWPDIAP